MCSSVGNHAVNKAKPNATQRSATARIDGDAISFAFVMSLSSVGMSVPNQKLRVRRYVAVSAIAMTSIQERKAHSVAGHQNFPIERLIHPAGEDALE